MNNRLESTQFPLCRCTEAKPTENKVIILSSSGVWSPKSMCIFMLCLLNNRTEVTVWPDGYAHQLGHLYPTLQRLHQVLVQLPSPASWSCALWEAAREDSRSLLPDTHVSDMGWTPASWLKPRAVAGSCIKTNQKKNQEFKNYLDPII